MDLETRLTLRQIMVRGWRQKESLPITVARVSIGVFFLITGAGKLFIAERQERMVEVMVAAGIPFPELNALFVSGVEFVGGGLLAIGLLSSLWSLMLLGTMVVAIVTTDIHSIPAGLNAFDWLSYFLFLPQFLLILLLSWLLFTGPGRFSVDRVLADRRPALRPVTSRGALETGASAT